MSVEALKEQARRFEQKEQWGKALDLYVQAISRLDQDEHPDISLFNRAGDLSTRVGNIQAAVEQYEKAVDLYVDAQLPNNAIAVCKKVIRNLPSRHTTYLKMGQIRASQGFLTDARANFLAYAERMQGEGQIDEALRALIEFADLAPDDHEIRIALASQFEQRERVGEAVEQLMQAHQVLARKGVEDQAREIAARIEELAPGTEIPAPGVAVPSASDAPEEADGFVFESTVIAPAEETAEVELGEFSLDHGTDDESEDEETTDEVPEEEPVEEFAAVDSEDVSFEIDDGAEDEEPETDEVDETIVDDDSPLPMLQFDDDEEEEEEESEDEEEDEDAEPLVLEVSDAAVDEASEVEDAIEDAMEEAVADAVDEKAEVEEAVAEHHRLFEDGDIAGAIASLHTLIDSEPDVGGHHQRMVEYAFRLDDPSALASAYLGLAQCFQRAGSDTQARSVFEQVLQSEPENAEAKAALGQEAAESEEVKEVASSDDYVDLGALLLGDEEKSTRMVVAYEEPTGDEEADFKRMLSQFKEKVAENIDADDVRAHYDLGTAYKEMGLIDEAIGEFQQALRASADHLPTYEMLGQTFIEKGEFEAAIRSLTRALDTPHEVEDEFLGIYYYLALSHQEMGHNEEALEFYDRVFSLDINFQDVTERIRALRD